MYRTVIQISSVNQTGSDVAKPALLWSCVLPRYFSLHYFLPELCSGTCTKERSGRQRLCRRTKALQITLLDTFHTLIE